MEFDRCLHQGAVCSYFLIGRKSTTRLCPVASAMRCRVRSLACDRRFQPGNIARVGSETFRQLDPRQARSVARRSASPMLAAIVGWRRSIDASSAARWFDASGRYANRYATAPLRPLARYARRNCRCLPASCVFSDSRSDLSITHKRLCTASVRVSDRQLCFASLTAGRAPQSRFNTPISSTIDGKRFSRSHSRGAYCAVPGAAPVTQITR